MKKQFLSDVKNIDFWIEPENHVSSHHNFVNLQKYVSLGYTQGY